MDGIHGPGLNGAVLRRLGTSAAEWANEFCGAGWARGGTQLLGELTPSPGGFLHSWLAAAIEAGRAAGYAEGAEAGRRTGWQEALAQLAPPPELAADLAGSHAADPAGSVPADLAGSDRVAAALEELVTLVRCVVAPHGHATGGGVRVIVDHYR